MKVRNDFVKIKANNREYTFHNLILDTYLDLYAKSNVQTIENASEKAMNYCLLKLDDDLEFNSTSKISNNSFDFGLFDIENLTTKLINGDIITNKNKIVTNYNYTGEGDNCFKFKKEGIGIESTNLDEFANRKITAMAFCSRVEDEQDIFAILDVSGCDITIMQGMKLNVRRRDTIENDMIFYSDSEQVTFPVHLSPMRHSICLWYK